MLKRALATVTAVLCAGAIAFAANIPLLTGPQPAGDLVSIVNGLINSINASTGLSGYVGNLPATTTGTTIQTLGTGTLPAALLKRNGQGVRITCFGSGTSTGTNTLTVQVGTATAYAVAGAATTAGVFQATVTVSKTGASTQQILSGGSFNVTPVTPTIISATQTDTAPINVTCSGTSTTSAQFTLSGMFVETLQ